VRRHRISASELRVGASKQSIGPGGRWVVMLLYDWGVAADVAGGRRVAPVGVSDQPQRAQQRMVEALQAVPAGVTARGWVMTMAYVPGLRGYQHYDLAIQAERDATSTVHMISGNG
jgi:hypothetical protein